jgi:hypothetical protein
MLRFCLIASMIMMLLLTACASAAATPDLDIPLPINTSPSPLTIPSASPTMEIIPSDSGLSNNPSPTPDSPLDYAPQPGDKVLIRGNAFVEDSGVLRLEGSPEQFQLNLTGTLPTPCHQLRVALSPPDTNNQIAVDVYSVVDPNSECIQVIAPFSAYIPLDGYSVGPTYDVFVNGLSVGEFTPMAP